jgi:hypothetical protein
LYQSKYIAPPKPVDNSNKDDALKEGNPSKKEDPEKDEERAENSPKKDDPSKG